MPKQRKTLGCEVPGRVFIYVNVSRGKTGKDEYGRCSVLTTSMAKVW